MSGDIVGDFYGVEGDEENGYVGEDIVGEIVGAVMQKMQTARKGGGRKQPPGLVGNQRVVGDGAKIARRQMSPVPLTTIPANGVNTITFRPQRQIRIERLVLEAATMAGVFVTGISIGAEPQFVNEGAVPMSVFSPQSFNMELRGNTTDIGIDIIIRVQNTTGADVQVGGVVFGTTLT